MATERDPIVEKGPIFIVGCPRSGTTVLSVLLNRHSAISVSPETAFYDEIAPFLPVRGEGLAELLGRWPRLADLGIAVPDVVSCCEEETSVGALLSIILNLYATARGKAMSGEKTPQHLNHIPRIFDDLPHARAICLVRDGRDVALSLRAMPWGTRDLAGAVDLWFRAIELSRTYAQRYPHRFIAVRYERLAARPEAVLDEVMAFLDLPFEASQLAPGPSELVLPRNFAWKGNAIERIDIALAQRRRSAASPEDLAFLNQVLGPTLELCGYEL